MTRSEKWDILNTGIASAEENMRLDSELLDKLPQITHPTVHLYDWKNDSATYGYFVDPFTLLRKQGVENRGLNLARRPTGGGIIFHLWDLAFSVVVPATSKHFSENTLENYAFVNQAVLDAAKEFLQISEDLSIIPEDFVAQDPSCKRFCMAQPTKYDVVLHGRKIAGAAQRKTKHGFLHQGTISLMIPSREYLEEVLQPGTEVLDAMFANTYALMGPLAERGDLQAARKEMEEKLIKYLTRET